MLNKNQKILYTLTLVFIVLFLMGISNDLADISKAPAYYYWPDRIVYLLLLTVLHLIWLNSLMKVTGSYFKAKDYKNVLTVPTLGLVISYLYIILMCLGG